MNFYIQYEIKEWQSMNWIQVAIYNKISVIFVVITTINVSITNSYFHWSCNKVGLYSNITKIDSIFPILEIIEYNIPCHSTNWFYFNISLSYRLNLNSMKS